LLHGYSRITLERSQQVGTSTKTALDRWVSAIDVTSKASDSGCPWKLPPETMRPLSTEDERVVRGAVDLDVEDAPVDG
jgi:hypothetical protein